MQKLSSVSMVAGHMSEHTPYESANMVVIARSAKNWAQLEIVRYKLDKKTSPTLARPIWITDNCTTWPVIRTPSIFILNLCCLNTHPNRKLFWGDLEMHPPGEAFTSNFVREKGTDLRGSVLIIQIFAERVGLILREVLISNFGQEKGKLI